MEYYANRRQENADTICEVADLIKNFDYSKKQLVEIVNLASTQPTKEQYIKILCPGDKNSFSLAPLDNIFDLSKSISDSDSEAIKSSFIQFLEIFVNKILVYPNENFSFSPAVVGWVDDTLPHDRSKFYTSFDQLESLLSKLKGTTDLS